MNNEQNEISGTQIAEQTLAECLKDTLKCYLALLEDGTNKASFKSCGVTVRHLASCLSNSSFIEFGDENEPSETDDEMESFYSEENE